MTSEIEVDYLSIGEGGEEVKLGSMIRDGGHCGLGGCGCVVRGSRGGTYT